MAPRTLADLLKDLSEVVDQNVVRKLSCAMSRKAAERLSSLLPLVRRIHAGVAGTPWQKVLQDGVLEPTKTTPLEATAGIQRSVYFFLGCAAYPKGDVALVVETRLTTALDASFWPFDTGALSSPSRYFTLSTGESLDEAKQRQIFEKFWGAGADLCPYVQEFLSAHFADPIQYVRIGQKGSPDHAPYHGLKCSKDNDRRAWTIEVQAHARVPLKGGSGYLRQIVLRRHQLVDDVPNDMVGFTKVSNDLELGVREEIEKQCAPGAS